MPIIGRVGIIAQRTDATKGPPKRWLSPMVRGSVAVEADGVLLGSELSRWCRWSEPSPGRQLLAR
jgi:hypothetical protein